MHPIISLNGTYLNYSVTVIPPRLTYISNAVNHLESKGQQSHWQMVFFRPAENGSCPCVVKNKH